MARYLPGGQIDSAFGVNGKVLSDFMPEGDQQGLAVAVRPDEKIVVGIVLFPGPGLAFARYNTHGELDSSFGVNGIGDTTYFTPTFRGRCLKVQADGKMVIAGLNTIADYAWNFAVARFNDDGKIDSSFGINGKATTFSPFGESRVLSVAIQADGKIIAAGYRDFGETYNDFALARYTTNGKTDSSFGMNGTIVTNFDKDNDEYIRSIAIQPDGKIIAAGYIGDLLSSDPDFALARYTQNGQLDSAFGKNGKVTTDFTNGGRYGDIGYSVCIQADGKIIVAGRSNNDFAVARYNNDEVLPVNIINLKAYAVGNDVKIEWTALNELNIFQYNIERSIDGKNFITLGNVKALDKGQQKIDYSYTDQVPAGGDNFYRIKSVSKDGAAKYTNTVKVSIATNESFVLISPNPVKNVLHITGLSSSSKTISIIDAKGKLLQQATISNNSYSFNTRQLSAGIYFVRISEGDKTMTLKFIKE